MSTVTVAPGQTNTERFEQAYGFQTLTDKAGIVIKNDKGDPKKEAVVISPEAAEKLSEANLFEGSVVTVSVDYPSTFDSLVQLASTPAVDEDGKPRDQKEIQAEIVKLFVNGAKSKVMNRLRALLTKTDDNGNLTFKEPANSVVDLTSEITSGSKRIFLTEEQKMWKSIAMLPADSKKAVWGAYLTSINKEFYTPAE